MGYGIGGYLSISKQTAFGTPTASPVYIPFVSESLVENKTLDDTILYFQFGSGTFDNQKNTSGLGFFKGVSLTLQCQIKE